MGKHRLSQINLIPRRRSLYALVGLLLSSILLATCATVFVGVYSYISTYLGDSDDTLILTQSGTGNFIATRYISMQVADSAEYVHGVILVSPETLTPTMIRGKTCFTRGIVSEKFFKLDNLELKAGRWLVDSDIHGAFIGDRAAQRIQIDVGDSFLIYSGLRDISLQMTAIGIYSAEDVALNDEILIPLGSGQILSGNYPSRVTYIRLKYNDSIISRNTLEERLSSQHLLTVKLVSNETGMAFKNGEVNVYDIQGTLVESGVSDSIGEISFGLEFGNYTIVASYGSTEVNTSMFLEDDTEISLEISVPSEMYPLNVKVWDNNQNGIPFTTVIAWKGSEIVQMRQTNSMGETNFSLAADIYQFTTLIWNNFTQEPIEFRQTANPIQSGSIIFWYKHFKLGVRTSDSYSGLFLNSTVTVKLVNGTIINSGITGKIGYVEFDDLTPTSYNISVKFGSISQNRIVELRSDRTVNFEILPRFDLEIHVFNDSTKLPINNSQIRINDPSNNLYENTTDENGIANFLLQLDTYNITVQSGNFLKNRIIYLNSSQNETFWMPNYNLTVIVQNISGILQDNVNVSLISSALNISKLSQSGLASFLVPPDVYSIIINHKNIITTQSYEIFEPIAPILFTIPPYNLTVSVLNGTSIGTPPLSGINISIFDNTSKAFITSSLTSSDSVSFLINPGVYNISANISFRNYYKIIEITQPYLNITIFSYPFNFTVLMTNGTTSSPQPDLELRLYNLTGSLIAGPKISDLNGYTNFLAEPGTYNITINNSNYVISKTVTVATPNTFNTFEFPPYNLTILVVNASNMIPIENALVEILQYVDNSTIFSKLTSSEGIAQFYLDPGKYFINLSYQNYYLLEYKEITADPIISYHIPPYKLEVQVTDYWGDPIVGANVSVNGGNPYITNSSGFVSIFLDPDIYSITAGWNNLTDIKMVDMTKYQENFQINFRLTQKFSLNVSVVNAISGRFLENVSVTFYDFSGNFVDMKTTDLNGLGQFTLTPQAYNVSVIFDQTYESQIINLTSDDSIIFSIIPTYQLRILTFDDSSTFYAKNVLIQILDLSGYLLLQGITDDTGECSFNLEYGTYNISLQKGLEHKSEVIDVSQTEYIAIHMAPYKLTVAAINSTTGYPLSNALVTIKTSLGLIVTSKLTDSLGLTEFLLDEGQYLVYLNISGTYRVKSVDLLQRNSSLFITFSILLGANTNIEIGDPLEYSASLLEQTLGLTETLVYVLAIILTVLVSFSIMNVVSACISESRQHIGIVRAIGGSNRQIYYMFNLRIALIALISGSIGGLCGILLGSIISVSALEISLEQIVTVQFFSSLFLLAIGITLLIGLISANLTLRGILKMPISSSIKEIFERAG